MLKGFQFLMDIIKESGSIVSCSNLIISMCQIWPEQLSRVLYEWNIPTFKTEILNCILQIIDAIVERIVTLKEDV